MTSAEYQQLARKPPGSPATRPAPGAAGVSPVSPARSPQKPAFPASPATPETWLHGAAAVAVGGRLHAEQLPDRTRIVVTAPGCDRAGLAAAVNAAVADYYTTPPPAAGAAGGA